MIVGAIDIGTNTVRLLIAVVANGQVEYIDGREIVTGLGTGLEETGALGEGAIEWLLEVLGEYGRLCADAAVERIVAVATSATRDASNAEALLAEASRVLGVEPRVISGDEEARLAFRGVAAGLAPELPVLVIDPGGGSTEFALGDAAPTFATSVDIGSLRLAERTLPQRPATGSQLAAAIAEARRELSAVDLPARPASVVGVGGTYTALGAMVLDLATHDRQLVHGSVVTREDLDRLVSQLASMTIAETEAIPSLDPARAPAILGGSVVAAQSLQHSGAASLTVSETGLLTGLALSA